MLMDVILVLQCPEVPLGRVRLELELESFVVAYLRLVCRHVHPCLRVSNDLFCGSSQTYSHLHTYAAGHKFLVGDRLKAGLGKRVLQRELFRLRHRVRPDGAVASLLVILDNRRTIGS